MDILLINPPNIEEVKVESESTPLGLLYIKEFLLKNNFNVALINFGGERSWTDISSKLKGIRFDVVGITCYTPQRHSITKLVGLCKKLNADCKIVLGGPHATFLDKEILRRQNSVDFIIRNEGEYAFLELMNVLKSDKTDNIFNIKGLTFRDGSKIVSNQSRNCISELTILPPPRFSKSDFKNNKMCKGLSFSFERFSNDGNVACILSSRGCNNSCLFCCNGAFWEKQNYFSPEYTFRQIEYLYNDHGVRYFDISDDDFHFSRDYVRALCDLIVSHGLDIHWWCAGRVNNVDKDTLVKMKQAGCFMVSYGFETGSKKLLETINKNRTADQAIESARLTKEAGLLVRCTMTIGHPGETEQSIDDTVNFLLASQPDQIGLYLLKLYPGTPIYHRFVNEGGISDDYWFDENEKDLPFYTTESSVERQLNFRDNVLYKLSDHIVSKYHDNVFHNVHMTLRWP